MLAALNDRIDIGSIVDCIGGSFRLIILQLTFFHLWYTIAYYIVLVLFIGKFMSCLHQTSIDPSSTNWSLMGTAVLRLTKMYR